MWSKAVRIENRGAEDVEWGLGAGRGCPLPRRERDIPISAGHAPSQRMRRCETVVSQTDEITTDTYSNVLYTGCIERVNMS